MKKFFIVAMGVWAVGMAYYAVVSCQTNKPKNLKVLKDKDMTVDEMKEFMRNFTLGLGVECDYCHNKNNYSSDEKPVKEKARKMIAMMDNLNNNFFNDPEKNITCYTCHRGAVDISSIPPGL